MLAIQHVLSTEVCGTNDDTCMHIVIISRVLNPDRRQLGAAYDFVRSIPYPCHDKGIPVRHCCQNAGRHKYNCIILDLVFIYGLQDRINLADLFLLGSVLAVLLDLHTHKHAHTHTRTHAHTHARARAHTKKKTGLGLLH